MSLTPIPGVTSRGVVGKWLASQAAAGALLTVDANGDVLTATSEQVQSAADLPSALAAYQLISTLAESIDDRVAALLVAGTGISLTYNDAAGTLTIATTGGGGGGTWGSITGTLANQVDLNNALNARQPLDSDLTAIAALTTTSFGRSLLTQADAAATRTTIGAGTVGGSLGSTANRVLRTSGTGGSTAQGSAVTIDDSGNISNVNSLVLQVPGAMTTLRADSFSGNWTTGSSLYWYDTIGLFVSSGVYFGIASGLATANSTVDVRLYRVSSGVWGMGTTSNNALGSLNLANLTASAIVQAGVIRPFAAGLLEFRAVFGQTIASLGVGNGVNLFFANGAETGWADGKIVRGATGPTVDFLAAGGIRSRNLANSADAPFSCSIATLSGGFNLASRTKTAILASSPATNAGRFQLSDSGLVGREVYPDGTNWRYASDDSIVT